VTARAIVVLVVSIVALLGFGRFMLDYAPVVVQIEGDRSSLRLTVDGTSRRIDLAQPIVGVRPLAPIAFRREHQIDGSDSTNMLTFNARYFAGFAASPYYRFQALLREEWRYSVWRNVEVADQFGRPVLRQPRPADDDEIGVPTPFRLDVELARPEIARSLELIDADSHSLYVEVNRNDKYVRLGPTPTRDASDEIFFYFPREPLPPLATLLDLLTRALALALGLVLLVGGLALLMPARWFWLPGLRAQRIGVPLGLAVLLGGCLYVTFVLFDRAPHILDAVAYLFQAQTFAAGRLSVPPPPIDDAFQMPFSLIWQDRWFVQYPPGTAALLALGILAHLPWLVEPALAVGAALLTALAVRRQYGPGTALLVLALFATSPFLLLNASAYLSHVPALFFGCLAMYAATRYEAQPSVRWAALGAAGLGLALLTREIVAVLYGVTIVLGGLLGGGWARGRRVLLDLLVMAAIVGASAGMYLGYNALLTGEPFLLPRLLLDSRDRYGFGPGVGFYNEHTLAAGLVNTEEQLVSLGFYLAGWPYGFSLAVLLLPFLTRRLAYWDHAHGLLVLAYVLSYIGYYYHGIAFGPRYYLEMLPSLLILTARGFATLTASVGDWLAALGRDGGWWRARLATGVLVLALFACNLGYYLPREAALYANFSGLPGGGPVLDDTIGHDLAGRYARLDNAVVTVDEWWIFVMYYASLNCPTLDCRTVFAVTEDDEARQVLARFYPGRSWYHVVDRRGVLRIEPDEP
jgi:hypothetical protein